MTHVVIDINGYYSGVGAALANTALGMWALSSNTSGSSNTAIGNGSLTANTIGAGNSAMGMGALGANTTGNYNTATGVQALRSNTSGNANTAIGMDTLEQNSTGYDNTAVGNDALHESTTGFFNTAVGVNALLWDTTGAQNTAVGAGALTFLTSGNSNIAVGNLAGAYLTTGTYNVHIANQGLSTDTNVIRIGDTHQTNTFVAGIRGVTTAANDAIPVVIDSAGQLGTVSSSRRFKEDIRDMDEASSGLSRLRPVTFRYKKPYADGSKPIQYGLIAEEVAEVYPDLVARSADGQIETVKYQVLDSMLLNEMQRQQAVIRGLEQQNQDLQRRLARLETALVSAPGEPKIPESTGNIR
jgi:hypothetical protein